MARSLSAVSRSRRTNRAGTFDPDIRACASSSIACDRSTQVTLSACAESAAVMSPRPHPTSRMLPRESVPIHETSRRLSSDDWRRPHGVASRRTQASASLSVPADDESTRRILAATAGTSNAWAPNEDRPMFDYLIERTLESTPLEGPASEDRVPASARAPSARRAVAGTARRHHWAAG